MMKTDIFGTEVKKNNLILYITNTGILRYGYIHEIKEDGSIEVIGAIQSDWAITHPFTPQEKNYSLYKIVIHGDKIIRPTQLQVNGALENGDKSLGWLINNVSKYKGE